MELHVNAVEASELPKTEFLTASDTYLSLQLTGTSAIQKTTVIESTQNPIWNQEFHFALHDPQSQKIVGSIQARNIISEDYTLGTFEVPLNNLKIGEIVDKWFKIQVSPGFKPGSTVRIIVQIAPIGHPAFQPLFNQMQAMNSIQPIMQMNQMKCIGISPTNQQMNPMMIAPSTQQLNQMNVIQPIPQMNQMNVAQQLNPMNRMNLTPPNQQMNVIPQFNTMNRMSFTPPNQPMNQMNAVSTDQQKNPMNQMNIMQSNQPMNQLSVIKPIFK